MVAKARRHAARFACVLGTGTFLRMKVPSAGGSAKGIAGDKGVRREAGSEGSPRQIHGQPLIAQGKQFTLSPGGGQRPPSGDKSCSGTMLAEVKRSWNKKLVAQRRAALCRERRLTEFLPILNILINTSGFSSKKRPPHEAVSLTGQPVSASRTSCIRARNIS